MKWLSHIIKEHKWITLLVFIISLFISATSQDSFQGNDKFSIITLIITVVTIIVGFAAAALTLFLGITDKPVIERIRKRGVVESLTNCFKDVIYFGGLVIVFSIVLSLYGNFNITIANVPIINIVLFIFVFSTILSLYYAFHLVNIILAIFKQLILNK